MREHRGGTVTFVFTDIEGSTALVKALRERWPEVRSAHRRIVRAAFEAHGGDEVDTQGDSFFYVFGRARDAALAAAEAQRGLAAYEWPVDGAIRIRIGMHTGEPVVSEEGYHGIGVHRAARIMAAGHGGQVLLSEATAAVLRDEEVAGVAVRDLGVHRLKDLDRPEHVYQVVAEGLDQQFPKIRTAGEAKPVYRRPLVIGATAGVLAAAVAIPVFALAGGSGSTAALGVVDGNAIGVVEPRSHSIVAETAGVDGPVGIAGGAGAVWVTSSDQGGSVKRIDPRTHAVTQTIRVGSGPQGIAVHGRDVWVANSLERNVSRISADTNGVTDTYAVGNEPTGVAVGGGAVWVTNADDGTVSRVNADTGASEGTIDVGSPVRGIAYGGGKLWVTDPVGNALVELAPGSGVVTRVNVGSGPGAVAYSDGTVWVANNLDGTISRVDAATGRVLGASLIGSAPNGIAATPDAAWATDEVTGTLARVDRQTGVVARKPVGGRPEGVASVDGSLWVAVQASGSAHRGGTVRLTTESIDFIDPARTYGGTVWQLISATSDGLVGFKRVGGSEGGTLVPDLAVALPNPSAGGKSYVFQLQPGIRFSTGRPLRASDVRYTMERLFRAHVPRPEFYTGIVGGAACKRHPQTCDLRRGVVADDTAGTVTFHLTAPDADFLYKLALPFAVVVPAGTPSAHDAPVVGTGPYKIATYKAKRLVRLVRNLRFRPWSRAAQPEGIPNEIVLRIGGKAAKLARQVERGSADWTDNFPLRELATARTRYPAQLHITPAASVYVVQLNTKHGPFADARARQALAYTLDRQRSVQAVGGADVAVATCQILPPSFPGYRPFCPYVAPGGAPDLVRGLALARASHADGRVVRVIEVTDGPLAALAPELDRALRTLGYRVHVRRFRDGGKYFDTLYGPGDFDAALDGWIVDYPAPSNFMVSLLGCAQVPAECDPAIDERIKELTRLQVTNQERANAGWAALDRQVTRRAVAVGILNQKAIDFVSKRVGNYQRNPVLGLLLDQLWVR